MRELSLYPAPVGKERLTKPSLKITEDYFKKGHQYVPLTHTIAADLETPVSIYLKLTEGPRRFLLESVTGGERPGRYSYIGWDPLISFSAEDQGVYREANGNREVMPTSDILQAIEETFAAMNVAPCPEIRGFYGGGIGYLGYDYVRRVERLPVQNNDALGLPEGYWMIPRRLVIFDHASNQITLVYLRSRDEKAEDAELNLNQMERDLAKSVPHAPRTGSNLKDRDIRSTFSREGYKEAVRRGVEYIQAGEIFQVVLSQRLSRPFEGDPFSLYRVLRRLNPSPYLFIMSHEDFSLVGSSPEALVRLNEREIILAPIAGTRPRGKDRQEDELREIELLNDPKERAEHIMLVDLGRNDVGRVARFGSVHVEELMHVERYSHVMHIVS
ncbi:MAG TPA: chorismate-binding protein, partial [Bacillota bacterium]|nr:chorismate-binding protein [Bacillota bacterium]